MGTVRIHCMTNPVTMQDVANILLAVGASPIMAQDRREAAEVALHSDALLLNTGVPDDEKWAAWECAGQAAEKGGRPIVLDPVGAGASQYRRQGLLKLLRSVHPKLIRCNQAEACVLLEIKNRMDEGLEEGKHAGSFRKFCKEANLQDKSGGVDSSLSLSTEQACALAEELAERYGCAVLVSGETDIVSDGIKTLVIGGGDVRIRKITGGGCMLSALCAWRLCTEEALSAAEHAGRLWRAASAEAGRRTDSRRGGIGTFHAALFDAMEELSR